MLSFKQFIAEAKGKAGPGWRLDKMETRGGEQRRFASHQAHIDGHHVRVNFSGSEDENHKGKFNYKVDYTVNDDFEKRRGMTPASGKKILLHVKKKIDHFVRQGKPKSLRFSSKHVNRIAVHDALSKKLVRKHGGEVKAHDGVELIHHDVHFSEQET